MIKKQDLFGYILSDEYWTQEAVEHFLQTISWHRREHLEKSYLEDKKESD